MKEAEDEMHELLASTEAPGKVAEDVFDWTMRLSDQLHKLGKEAAKAKRERALANRRASYARKKRLGLLKPRKTKADKERAKQEERQRLLEEDRRLEEYYRENCTCHLGNPPCSFCTSYDPDAEDKRI